MSELSEFDIEHIRQFGGQVDFGRAAADYSRHRAGFPQRFFNQLTAQLAFSAEQTALDIGTGTGTLARGLARKGLRVAALDPSAELMAQARLLDAEAGVSIAYQRGTAEALPYADESFDLVTAGQCWHWFDRPQAAQEAARVLRPGGVLVVAHFDWLPLRSNVVEATEALILKHNPDWPAAGGTGLYPQWLADLADAGFKALKTASFDIDQPYSHEAWRGRIRASAGIKASLDAAATKRFDEEHKALLAEHFPHEPLAVPHRVWWALGRKAS